MLEIKNCKTKYDWLCTRHQGVGGSDIAAIMGLNKRVSPLDIYLDKTSEVEDTTEEDWLKYPKLFFGTKNEKSIAEYFELKTGFKTRRPNGTYVDGYYIANPDRLIQGRKGELLEMKNCSTFTKPEWNKGIPIYYKHQVNYYLGVMQFHKAYVAVCFDNGDDYYIIEHDFNEHDFEIETTFVDVFWNEYVLKRKQPSAKGIDIPKLAGLYGKGEETFDITIYDEELDTYMANKRKIEEFENAMKPFKEANEEIKAHLLDYLKGNQGASDNYLIKNTLVQSNRLDTTALKNEMPEVYKQFLKTTESYRFTVKEN